MYMTNKALLKIKKVQIIEKNDFVIATLNFNSKIIVMHMAI